MIKDKICKNCGVKFTPRQFLQKYCRQNDECLKVEANLLIEKKRLENKKSWNKEKKERKEKLMTHKDWLKKFEAVFNEFIRERDKDKPCVSCDALPGTYTLTAGHYYPAGSNPSVRFNEDNVHGQCWFNCNKNKHGNQTEYIIRLKERIGDERLEKLHILAKQKTNKLSIPEIQEKIKIYKEKIKTLKDE